jgi:antitoxin component YwqK of YwqJK toxin-antitoxin module
MHDDAPRIPNRKHYQNQQLVVETEWKNGKLYRKKVHGCYGSPQSEDICCNGSPESEDVCCNGSPESEDICCDGSPQSEDVCCDGSPESEDIYCDGSFRYVGDWKTGVGLHGKGKQYYWTGLMYEGEW